MELACTLMCAVWYMHAKRSRFYRSSYYFLCFLPTRPRIKKWRSSGGARLYTHVCCVVHARKKITFWPIELLFALFFTQLDFSCMSITLMCLLRYVQRYVCKNVAPITLFHTYFWKKVNQCSLVYSGNIHILTHALVADQIVQSWRKLLSWSLDINRKLSAVQSTHIFQKNELKTIATTICDRANRL